MAIQTRYSEARQHPAAILDRAGDDRYTIVITLLAHWPGPVSAVFRNSRTARPGTGGSRAECRRHPGPRRRCARRPAARGRDCHLFVTRLNHPEQLDTESQVRLQPSLLQGDRCPITSISKLHDDLQYCRLQRMRQAGGTTTVRVSRRTHQVLSELAAQQGRSVSDLLDRLAEQARRRQILAQYNARMGELFADPEERGLWQRDVDLSEASAAEVVEREPAT